MSGSHNRTSSYDNQVFFWFLEWDPLSSPAETCELTLIELEFKTFLSEKAMRSDSKP